jgi:hypothetical protein
MVRRSQVVVRPVVGIVVDVFRAGPDTGPRLYREAEEVLVRGPVNSQQQEEEQAGAHGNLLREGTGGDATLYPMKLPIPRVRVGTKKKKCLPAGRAGVLVVGSSFWRRWQPTVSKACSF